MKTLSKVLVVVAVLGLAGLSYAKGAKGEGKGTPALTGKVKSVDGVKLTIEAKGGDKEVVTDANTKVTLNGNAATLADLKAGMIVKITPVEGTAQQVDAKDAPVGKAKGGEKAPK
jgi:hypothetical protein